MEKFYLLFQEDILYKGDFHKYFSFTAITEVIVALRNYWKSRRKMVLISKQISKNDDTFANKSHCLWIQNLSKLWLFVDFIKFYIGSKWHYTD